MPRLTIKSPASGVALITVMLILSVLVIFISYMIESQYLVVRQTETVSSSEKSYLYSRQAEVWAVSKLRKEVASSAYEEYDFDAKSEAWNTEQLSVKDGSWQLTANITDRQGKLNINNLVDGAHSGDWSAIFKRLLQALSIDPVVHDAVVDWIDSVQNQSGIYEDNHYSFLDPAYKTSNQPLKSLGEMLLIHGVDAQVFEVLKKHVTVLPKSDIKLNIQTASLELLRALIPQGQTSGEADNLFTDLEINQYTLLTDVTDNFTAYAGLGDLIDLKSAYFDVNTEVEFDGDTYSFSTGIFRDVVKNDNTVSFNIISRQRN